MKELVLVIFFSSAIGYGELEWSEPTCLWSDTVHVQNPNIIETPDGKIVAAWSDVFQPDSTRIFIRNYDGIQWSPPSGASISPAVSFISPFPLAVDRYGYLWTIGVVDGVVYGWCWSGSIWSEPESISNAPGLPPRLTNNRDGVLWAVLNRWTDSSYFYVTYRDSGRWQLPELWVQTLWCEGGGDFRLACSRTGQTCLIWGGLELGVFDSFHKEIIIPYVHTCQPVRMTFDTGNRPWLFFQFEFDSLVFSTHSEDGQWVPYDTIFPSSNWYNLSCCTDSNGAVWVASAQDTGSRTHIILRSYDSTVGKWSAIVEYNPMPNCSEYNPVLLATLDQLWMVWNGDSGTARRVYISSADLPVSITESGCGLQEPSLSIIPNPVRDRTIIQFSLPEREYCRLAIYDQTGRVNSILGEGWLAAGGHRFFWERKQRNAGVYFCLLENKSHTMQKKIVVIE